ncbi:hypothetical protein [Vitreoscilla filiformis]|uniref:hypothetical protein n=1 Tax=Vitreoscilla filiformis TaxID=63 RepID=UPI0012FDCBA3|nr:hypothetical protein [Vitreoscilla filiformis]
MKLSLLGISAVVLTISGGGASAQQYGYGSTLQPSQQYLAQQQRMASEREAQRNASYYQRAQQPTSTSQSRFMYPDSGLRSMGFSPQPVYLSNQAITAIGNCAQRGLAPAVIDSVGGRLEGSSRGAAVGAAVGFVKGCLGY